MSDTPKVGAQAPRPQEVYELPWEQSGGSESFNVAAEKVKGLFDAQDSERSDPPKGTEKPAPAEDAAEDDDSDGSESEEAPEAGESDEDGEESDEGSPEPDEEDEDDGSGDDDGEDDETWEVTVNGEKVQVTRSEAIAGYQRQSDYTRKTQALADERRADEAKQQESEALREQYKQGLELLHGALEKSKGPQVDWDKLRQENPQEFAVRWAENQRVEAEQQKVAQEHARVTEEQRREFTEQREARLRDESAKLVQAIPEWQADPKVAEKEQGELQDYAVGLGFTPEQLEGVEDHRVFVMLRKAMLHDRSQQATAAVEKEVKAKAKQSKQDTLKPGVKRGPGKKSKAAEKRMKDARAKLAQSGSLHDAAAVFMEYLDD